ncbi:MAG: hypothetical protein A3F18_01070 [Legionellales bacterium RIFCSPHIGHO2_12_FULL_37_14]|nr:MAG: hypothetical protein A3F18_01070 [Legionellales bacterium RIFCSPHIGHO2_12_FULL_37_14]
MSEKRQHTAAMMRNKMLIHYGDEVYHKHNKNHLIDPPHRDILLAEPSYENGEEEETKNKRWSFKTIRNFKGRKTRTRLDKGRVH